MHHYLVSVVYEYIFFIFLNYLIHILYIFIYILYTCLYIKATGSPSLQLSSSQFN